MDAETERLAARRIRAALAPAWATRLTALTVHETIDSTNAYLLRTPPPARGEVAVCLAEHQSAGQGRRGARWRSPFARGLCLSLGAVLSPPACALPTFSLAVGVALVDALAALGVGDAQLKWPNDILREGRKLGGILVQSKSADDDGFYVVAGVGLNVHEAPLELDDKALPAACLNDVVPEVSRNVLAARVLEHLMACAQQFEHDGFTSFAERWRAADYLRDKPVRATGDGTSLDGVADGVDEDGALLLVNAAGTHRVVAGAVSVRARGGA